jgi:putative restriction endonuclease
MEDHQIRMAAFDWLDKQNKILGDVLPRSVLSEGFDYFGHSIRLVGPQGIWKPAIMELPLSITTVVGGPYEDSLSGDGLLAYKYRGTDPDHRDNVGLREVMRRQIPLIYFLGIEKGKYIAEWPVYIVYDHPGKLEFSISIEDKNFDVTGNMRNNQTLINEAGASYLRGYSTTQAVVRLHQRAFRARVLLAYREQCAFCRLRHQQLLDAAHIIPDREQGGEPIIPNGLSLCKIHHAVFDSYFVTVTPEFKIVVREDILRESDGPMLQYGIQQMHEQKIILPDNKKHWPDRERLEERFKRFREVS